MTTTATRSLKKSEVRSRRHLTIRLVSETGWNILVSATFRQRKIKGDVGELKKGGGRKTPPPHNKSLIFASIFILNLVVVGAMAWLGSVFKSSLFEGVGDP